MLFIPFFSILGLVPAVLGATTEGCGTAPPLTPGGETQTFTVQSGGLARTYNVHLPSNYDQDSADGTPLILSFHGNNRDAYEQEALSQFSNETYNPNAIAVYPQGVDVSSIFHA